MKLFFVVFLPILLLPFFICMVIPTPIHFFTSKIILIIFLLLFSTHSSPFFLYLTLNILNRYITGSVFWSTLVSWVNGFARLDSLPKDQQNYLSVIILLMFLLILPFIFDTLARNYEGMKLESEIQNTIMTRCAM